MVPQSAFADDGPWIDGNLGAFGGMTLFPDTAYVGSFGPQADLVFGKPGWALRPHVGAGFSFNVGPAPYDSHLLAEAGAALGFLGGAQLGVGSVFVPQDGALQWETMYVGLKKALFAVPIPDPSNSTRETGMQFELGPYFRYHWGIGDDTSPSFPSAGITFGISRE
jgi:hypothetical protein